MIKKVNNKGMTLVEINVDPVSRTINKKVLKFE